MRKSPLAVVILAAGKGTRMRSALPKALTPLCGRPLIGYLLEAARRLGAARTVVVAGYGFDEVRRAASGAVVVRQSQLLGSGHAVGCASKALANHKGPVMVLYCDTPMVSTTTLKSLLADWRQNRALCTLLSATVDNPTGYGRVEGAADGEVSRIVEEGDATALQKSIRRINVGCYVFEKEALFGGLKAIRCNSKKKEYYLTDVVEILSGRGCVRCIDSADNEEIQGVNSKRELAALEALAQRRILDGWMDRGVRVPNPLMTTVDAEAKIGQDTVLLPGTVIEEGSVIGRSCTIGPFARIRGGSVIGDGAVIGNFVEIVRSKIGSHTNVKHLSYIGDAVVGKSVNVGAGTITANYDGVRKHRTVVKDGAHLGSGTVLVAPVTIGRGASTGAGAIVIKGHDVPDGAVVVGVPAKILIKGER